MDVALRARYFSLFGFGTLNYRYIAVKAPENGGGET